MINEQALDWEAIRCFVAVARRGSLSEAADELGMSIPTISRRIDGLETQLALKLLQRGPRGARLTEAGHAILQVAEPGARQLSQIARRARALQEGPNLPAVRISATESVIADVLAPRLDCLRAQDPSISIDLEVSNDIANLNAGRTDVAIRMVRPAEETLMARRLPVIRLGLFASPDYLKGKDLDRLVLSDEHLVWLDRQYGEIAENIWLKAQGLEASIRFSSSSVRALLNAAVAGVGIAPLPAYAARKAGLMEVPHRAMPERQPWLVFHRDTKTNPRLQLVRDWIVTCFKEEIVEP
ncbi:LysR family transcriptional regulator [Aquidulcibacter sp.]|uniref:LysR family transcriptional regulator n=1 Tax=Aquidulcibacter sp. TaxID=2052990 RepID=UPI0025C0F4FF|nr:LysR family transcriptional regulator [Aquidulcibacter sp.]MCA3696959.1 LysR family transcriptional regulator [Aquidulcibacter sp.]